MAPDSEASKTTTARYISASHSGNHHSFNTSITYRTPTPPDVPATFKELIARTGWGVSPPEIDLDHLCDRYNRPEAGTGEWIFRDARYKEWQMSEKSELLWLCGGPGKGKTMLTKRVAAEFLKGPSDPSGGVKLVFHFVSPELPTDGKLPDEAESPQRKLAKVACDILYGILQQDANLFDGCRAELENQGDKLFTNHCSIWKVLRKAIQDCPPGPIYILIDGVDGFKESLCRELIERILGLMDIRRVKIFLTSRDEPHVSNNLCEHAKVNLDTNKFVEADVRTFIKRRVKRLKDWDDDQKGRAIEALRAKSEGTFLWASLVIENLTGFSTGPDYENFLSKLPLELEDVYRKMLRSVKSRARPEEALNLIRSVALALRPLTFSELGHILRWVEEEAKSEQPGSPGGVGAKIPPRTEKEIEKIVKSLSFLRATPTHVSMVHRTAVEYLFDENREIADSLRVPPKSKLDLTISWECFRYLHRAFEDLEISPKRSVTRRNDRSRESSSNRDHQEKSLEAPWRVPRKGLQEVVAQWPCLRYAAESWFHHARRSAEILGHKLWADSTRNWLDHQFFTSDTIRKPWIELCGDPKMEVLAEGQTPLHIVVCLGLTPLVEIALSDYNARTEGTNNNRSPLHLAAKFMSGAYKILIDKGGPSLLTTPDQDGNTPLHEATIFGHRPMLVGLVKKFATPEHRARSGEINRRNNSGNTPLHLAFQYDHPDIVEFLVKNHASLTIRNNQGMTASELGAKLGRGDSLDILRRLVEDRETEQETVKVTVNETVEEVMKETERGTSKKAGKKARKTAAKEAMRGTTAANAANPYKEPGGVSWRRLWRGLLGGLLGCLGVDSGGEFGGNGGGDRGRGSGGGPRRARGGRGRGGYGRSQGRDQQHQHSRNRSHHRTPLAHQPTAHRGEHPRHTPPAARMRTQPITGKEGYGTMC